MNWNGLDPAALAAERRKREERGAASAQSVPAMAREHWARVGDCDALVLTPDDAAPDGAILFLHGGGWVFGSPRQSLGLTRRIACQARRRVVSLAYPLAPEHPYPAAIDTAAAAITALAREGALAIAGGSAGAQIALAAMLLQRDRSADIPGAGLLFCGAFSQTLDSPSQRSFGQDGGRLTTQRMADFIEAYAAPLAAPYADVTGTDLRGLPPLWFSVGDRDPLLSDTLAVHAQALDSGVSAALEVVPGASHGFMNDFGSSSRIDDAVEAGVEWLVSSTFGTRGENGVGGRLGLQDRTIDRWQENPAEDNQA